LLNNKDNTLLTVTGALFRRLCICKRHLRDPQEKNTEKIA
jgi:hypothetical protein